MKPNGMEGIQNGLFVKYNKSVTLSLRPESECPTEEKDPLRRPGFLPLRHHHPEQMAVHPRLPMPPQPVESRPNRRHSS